MKNISRKIVGIFDKLGRSPEDNAFEAECKTAIRTLRGYTDRELKDIGVSRCNIENAVRYGIPANDTEYNQNTVA